MASHSATTVKLVGSNGQISLGKQFAGRQVLVEEQEPGVWLVRTASVIPDNERWAHAADASAALSAAMAWSSANAAQETSLPDFDASLSASSERS
jgi:hypothetical protein